MVAASPRSAATVLAVHVCPTFNAGIWAETSFTIRLYVITLDCTAFWISKPEGKGMNKDQS